MSLNQFLLHDHAQRALFLFWFHFFLFAVIFAASLMVPMSICQRHTGHRTTTATAATTNLNQNLIFALTRSIFKVKWNELEQSIREIENKKNEIEKLVTRRIRIEFSNNTTYFSWCLDANKLKFMNSSKDCTWDSQYKHTHTSNMCIVYGPRCCARTQTDTPQFITQSALV